LEGRESNPVPYFKTSGSPDEYGMFFSPV